MMFDDAVTEMRFRAAVYSIGNLPMFICLFETVFQLGFILRFQFQLTCTVCTAIANASRMYKPSWPVCLSGEVGAFGTCTYFCVFGPSGTPGANIFRNEMSWGNAIYMALIKEQLKWTTGEE